MDEEPDVKAPEFESGVLMGSLFLAMIKDKGAIGQRAVFFQSF